MSAPKYLTIIKKIEAMIRSGEFPEGSKLPTHRELAKQLETTPITVAKAYKELAEKQLVESFVGRGSFVCGHSQLSDVIRAETQAQQSNLSILQPCLSAHVDRLNQVMTQAITKGNSYPLWGYAEHSGFCAHRESGARWASHYGLDVSSGEHIVLTGGAQHALSALISCFTKAGDTIAVEAITYPGILSIASLLDRRVVPVAMDDEGMLPTSLSEVCASQNVAMVVVVPSHQNPTTVTMSETRRKAIAEVINQHEIWLIEDDIYGFLNEQPISAITNFAPERAFHVTSLSKAISPGLRCGYVKTPISETERFSAFVRATLWMPTPLTFAVAATLIQSGEAFRLAEAQRQIAEHRQQLVKLILADHVLHAQEGSYHCWLMLPDVWSSDLFTLAAKNRDLLVSSASYFKADGHASTPKAIRISVMAIEDEEIFIQALKKLAELLDQHPHSGFIHG